MIKLPRVYENGKFVRVLHPVSVSITQNITPLDSATITLRDGDELKAGSWVELFTPYGSAGFFRVRNPKTAYGMETPSAELEHMISVLGEYLVKEELSEMMAADKAFRRVFKHYDGGLWQVGSLTGLSGYTIALEAKYDRVLDSLLSILEQIPSCMMTFDFKASPWKVNVVKKPANITAEGRLSRNVTSATVTYDDTELVTRCWYQTYNKKKEATWTYKNADSYRRYGIIEGKVNTSADMTTEEINTLVDTYLADHMEPRISVSIQANDLSEITGAEMDKFTVGKMMRLNLVDYGVASVQTITSVVWQDVYGDGAVTVNLGEEEDSVVTFLHNLDAKGTGGGGGGKAKDKEEKQWSEYSTEWKKTDEYIAGIATRQDRFGNILEQAGLTLNSKGVLVYAKDAVNGLYAQFEATNSKFRTSLKNTKEGLESEILQTAREFRRTIKDTKKDIHSEIVQTSDTISQTITDTASGLQSQIKQERDRISLVVSGTGDNAKINPGSITLAINEADESEIHLDADHVYIGNQKSSTVIAGKCTLDDVTANLISSRLATLANVVVKKLTLSDNGYISLPTGDGSVNLTGAAASDFVRNLKITLSGNTYTLSKVTLGDASWQTVGTFSRAVTSWNVGWSNGKWTATAQPQDQSAWVTVYQGTASWSGRTVTIPIRSVSSESNTGVVAMEATATYNLPKSGITMTRTKKSTEPTTDGTLSKITSNGWYQLDVTAAGVTKTWKVQVAV